MSGKIEPLVLPTTRGALTNLRTEARSLQFDRFANPWREDQRDGEQPHSRGRDKGERDETARRRFFEDLAELPKAVPQHEISLSREAFWSSAGTDVVRARLRSRLLVNTSGGILENAGLSLDRFGLPIIPGSAVKGCARRMALQEIRESFESGAKDAGDLFLLALHVFGWVEKDWDPAENEGVSVSDLRWSCADAWREAWSTAAERLLEEFRIERKRDDDPWAILPTYAGEVAFLSAHPNRDPGIEVDVLTCHHRKYYDDRSLDKATDTENPVPVCFPAVRQQEPEDFFSFPLLGLRGSTPATVERAKSWLADGLEIFGIGGKTNAGYGWFIPLDREEAFEAEEQERLDELKASAEAERAKALAIKEEAEAEAAAEKAAGWEKLKVGAEVEVHLETFAALKQPDQLRGKINPFSAEEQFWPPGMPEATDAYRVALLVHLLEKDTSLLEGERGKKKSKPMNAIQNLAAKYGAPLPD